MTERHDEKGAANAMENSAVRPRKRERGLHAPLREPPSRPSRERAPTMSGTNLAVTIAAILGVVAIVISISIHSKRLQRLASQVNNVGRGSLPQRRGPGSNRRHDELFQTARIRLLQSCFGLDLRRDAVGLDHFRRIP